MSIKRLLRRFRVSDKTRAEPSAAEGKRARAMSAAGEKGGIERNVKRGSGRHEVGRKHEKGETLARLFSLPALRRLSIFFFFSPLSSVLNKRLIRFFFCKNNSNYMKNRKVERGDVLCFSQSDLVLYGRRLSFIFLSGCIHVRLDRGGSSFSFFLFRTLNVEDLDKLLAALF